MLLGTYEVHDNYARPFKVVVEKTKVTVFDMRKAVGDEGEGEGEKVKTYKPIKVFVGSSTGRMPMSDHKPTQAKEFYGNSILLQLSSKKFAYIGHEIYEFVTADEPVAYYSLIGNNDVPYPVLLGAKEVYFMLEHVHVRREDFPERFKLWENAYWNFYKYSNDEKDHVQAVPLPMRNLKMIRARN
jgi:hypothetical protein